MPWSDHVLDALLPTACFLCGDTAGAHPHFRRLCDRCASGLHTTIWPLPYAPEFVSCAWALGPYEGDAGELIRIIKYGRHPGLLDEIAEHLAHAARSTLPRVDLVTWAPSSPARSRMRGFTPAEHLAKALAKAIGRPARALFRLDEGPALASLNAGARKAVLIGRLHLHCVEPPPVLVVVDDVLTSGSTLSTCARRLLNAGARTVYGLTWAAATR